jgi:hypothetical protein
MQKIKETNIKPISSDTVIAICAVCIATFALGVSIWQGIETRKHNKLSVKPYISIRVLISKQSEYMGIQIENNGIGPAIIKKCIVFVDGKPTQIDSYSSWKKIGKAAGIFDKNISFMTFPKGTVVKEGQVIPLICYPKQHWTDQGRKIVEHALSCVRVKIIYESIYGEEFVETNLEKDA